MVVYDIRTGVKKIKTKTALIISGITIGFGGLIVALAMPLGANAAVGGPTCNVPADYSTIQAAVNVAGCTTINVASGTHAESVNIPRDVILNGPNAGTSGAGTRGAEAIVNDINITSSNVIVDGFTFSTAGSQMNITGATKLSGVKVQNNIFSGYGSVGIPTQNAGNLEITRNLFKLPLANTEAMQIKADPSTPGGCNGTVVSNNVFTAATNNGGAEINFSCTGSNSTGVTVSGNTDTGLAGTGNPSFTAFSGVIGGIAVTNNHVTGTPTAGSAIWFWGGVTGPVDISNNVIKDFGAGNGIDITNFLDGNSTGSFTFSHNNLSNNVSSIRLRDAFNTGASVTANRNNVSGNTTAGIQNDSATLVANATCNWWGAANGPGPVGPGTGDNVSTGVTFSPWLTTPNLNGPCAGGLPHPVTKADCKDGGWKNFTNDNGKPFKNKDQCIDYVVKHEHKIKGDVDYTAYTLKRHAEFDMNTADNGGSFTYSDANHDWYKVDVSSVNVSGHFGYFAGVVTKASNPSWVGQWLFAKVQDNSPDKIWGSFTDKTTAQNGVTNMTSPVDGPFNVTKGNLEVK
jgi:hypothetical protein